MQRAGAITYRAEPAGQAVLGARTCEGKAALVLRGHSARIVGLGFADLHTQDGNGAGIRLEQGAATVRQAWFASSDQGILTANDPAISLRVERSSFRRLGRCGGGRACAHSIYIGRIGSAAIRQCRFAAGTGGHYLKSRAARILVSGNAFDDTAGQRTNYLIDLPEGASGVIADNRFRQGSRKDNGAAMIAIGAENRRAPADLAVRDNRAGIARAGWPTAFIVDWTRGQVTTGGNVLSGAVSAYRRPW
ncbi:MAG: right-handed parallel beta-helix repeat-containing protein [Sphingomonadales bacterium]|nr:right-handed parallel beta-helix repeat-containing protein [Sphingomonadales bacterium]